jgi:hypothetical protein
MAKPPPLTPQEAEAKIQLFLAEGVLRLSTHCKFESRPARDVSIEDIKKSLKLGRVINQHGDEGQQNWQDEVVGTDLDGDQLNCLTGFFDRHLTLFVITVLERS